MSLLRILFALGIFALVAGCETAEKNTSEALPDQSAVEPTESNDSEEADESGEVEMMVYYMVFLKRGPEWTAEMTPEVEAVLKGHFEHITRMEKEGKLALAGPFGGTEGLGSLTGLFLFRAESIEQAQEWANLDPGVQSGRFTTEILQWYGPKSLSY